MRRDAHTYAESDAESFTAYVSAARAGLRRQAFLLCDDWHEADDLVQDTLASMYRRWPDVSRRGEMESYAHTALVRRFLSVRRQTRWRREVPSPAPPDQPHTHDHAVDDRISMLACLRRLPPRQRAVIVLRFWEDLSIQQTAKAMGVSPGTVASQHHKALTTLRRSLADLR
jgi:RNA polymerase sigma-70 factor (sigma-E family)